MDRFQLDSGHGSCRILPPAPDRAYPCGVSLGEGSGKKQNHPM